MIKMTDTDTDDIDTDIDDTDCESDDDTDHDEPDSDDSKACWCVYNSILCKCVCVPDWYNGDDESAQLQRNIAMEGALKSFIFGGVGAFVPLYITSWCNIALTQDLETKFC